MWVCISIHMCVNTHLCACMMYGYVYIYILKSIQPTLTYYGTLLHYLPPFSCGWKLSSRFQRWKKPSFLGELNRYESVRVCGIQTQVVRFISTFCVCIWCVSCKCMSTLFFLSVLTCGAFRQSYSPIAMYQRGIWLMTGLRKLMFKNRWWTRHDFCTR